MYQPPGVIGILVPWNYPVLLAISPLIGALAAGNRVMLKMSEYTPATGSVLQSLLARAFSDDVVAVVNGDVELAKAFAALPFDHLLFTGSATAGREVMRAAAAHLSPVTFELGGKSPAIIGPDAEVEDAARRIAWGKCLNAGQSCVAPDYVLCPAELVEAFAKAYAGAVPGMYPSLRDNPDYSSVITRRHHERLRGYLRDAELKGARTVVINPAAEDLSDTRKLAPALVLDPSDEMLIMQEEIFGPLLPVVPYADLDEAIVYVEKRPRPLALYYFGFNRRQIQEVLCRTHSGSVCVNDVALQAIQEDLPFGGTGASGFGQYHGREGFLALSKARPVLYRGRINPLRRMYPPFGRAMHRLIYRLLLGQTDRGRK